MQKGVILLNQFKPIKGRRPEEMNYERDTLVSCAKALLGFNKSFNGLEITEERLTLSAYNIDKGLGLLNDMSSVDFTWHQN